MNAGSEPEERRFEEAVEGLLERGAPGWFRRRAAAEGVPEMPGDRIGSYRLLEELGRGGQAVVFLAEDERLHRKVALKVFENVPGGDPARHLRFAREAEAASRLDHPGICTIYESGTEGLIAWIAMQYVEGESLAVRLGREREGGSSAATSAGEIEGAGSAEALDEAVSGPITTGHLQRAEILEVVEIMEKVARALHAAHEAGVMHRDVKPANIMISKAGDPLLMDFGLARQEDSELPTLTRTGDLFGTPAYMSPEQLTRQSILVDRRTDVWSLGVTLYECLARQRPFEEPTREALYQAILTKEPPDLRKLSSAVPRDLRTVLETALEKDRDRRYQTALALAEDLRRVRGQLPIEARPISAAGRLLRWARRRPARAALAVCLMVGIPVLTGLGTWIVAHRGDVARQQRADLESRVGRLVAEGLLELEHGSLSRARECFETARALLPEQGEATAGLAVVHLSGGDPEAAIAVIPAAGARVPAFALIEAEALRMLGREKEAQALTEGLPEPTTPFGHYLVGLKALSDGQAGGKETPRGANAFRQAQEAFERAIFLSTRARLIHYVSLAQAVGQVESTGDLHPAVVGLETLWPRSSLALFCLGNTLDEQGRREEAVTAYRKAIDINPRFVVALNNLGITLDVMGRPEEAMTWLERALEVDPAYAPSHYNLGNVHLAQGRLDAAIAAYENATEIDPRLAMAFHNLGNARLAGGDHEGAVAAFRKAIEIEPEDAQNHYGLGNAYRTHGDIEEAVAAYERALEIAPDFAEVHCNLGIALQGRGEFEQAVEHLRKGDALGRRRGEGWPYDSKQWVVQALGAWSHVLYDQEEFARAREVLLQAVEVLPEDPELLNWVARVLVDPEHDPRTWDGEAALPLATKAVTLTRRENPDFLDTLAWARLRSGDAQGAIAVQGEILETLASGGASAERMAKAREQLAHFRAAVEEPPR